MKGIVCDWVLGCLLATPSVDLDVQPIPNPHDLQFRSILYQVYQRQDEQALVEGLVIESLAPGAGRDRTRYLLAELSTAFSIGARSIALEAAAKLESETLAPEDRIRVAVLCARDSHQHRNWSTLERELEQIDGARRELQISAPLPAEIVAEISFMRAELATAQGDYIRAEAIIRTELSQRDSASAFALFNLGAALRNSGMPTQAEKIFSTLASMRVYTDDALDLKQRALVALSIVNQQSTSSASAEAYLRQIPAQSRYHDQALVAYANLTMAHGDYELAARIWSMLLQESVWSNAGKTAELGYPLSLENMDQPRIALTQYRVAEATITQRQRDLSNLAARVEDADWNRRLIRALERLPESESSSDPTLQAWREGLGHDDWFAWLTSDDVQRLLQELRELDHMMTWSSDASLTRDAALTERRRSLAARVARLIDEHQQRLSAALAAILRDEVAMADEQLRFIQAGVARTTDRIAQDTPPAIEP